MMSIANELTHRDHANVIASVFFPLTESCSVRSFEIEHRRSDARPEAILSPTIAIQGSASVPGVHARSSGSPKDYVEPTYVKRRG